MTEPETEREAARVSRRWPLISGGIAVLLVLALGAIILYRAGNLPFEFDAEWMEELVEHRSPFWEVPALLMDHIGGGIIGVFIVPILIIVVLCVVKRFWAALYFALAVIRPGGMGFGDVKLSGVIGLYLGWVGVGSLIVGAFSAFLLGGVFSIVLVLSRGAGRRTAIPFGPWMIVGAGVGVFFGETIANAYLALIGFN